MLSWGTSHARDLLEETHPKNKGEEVGVGEGTVRVQRSSITVKEGVGPKG
jgi:hypothetical protein